MNPCLPFDGTILSTGYGQKRLGNRRRQLAHRWTWEQAHGPIPPGLVVMHTCDNPSCVEITHLRLGTQRENLADRDAKGRNAFSTRTHCPKGHPYDEVNTYYRKDRPGQRECRTCNREWKRRR